MDDKQDIKKVEDEIKAIISGDSPASTENAISKFIDKLIEEKGFVNLLDEVREEMKKDLASRLDEFIAARIITALSDENVLVFEEMLKSQKEKAEVQKFISEHIPDFLNYLTNILLEFRAVYLGIINAPIIAEEGKEEMPQPSAVDNLAN